MKRVVMGLAIGLLNTLASIGDAKAQNADPFFFGDEAALGSGAVIASGRDSGAFWYNPAGLGGLNRGLVSASASTFGLRFRTVPNAVRVISGGQEITNELSSTDVISVPNAIVAAAKLGDRFTIAGGLLVTGRDVRSALLSVPATELTDARGPLLLTHRLDIQADGARYHVGPSFAAVITNALRLGGSLFLTYTKETQSFSTSALVQRAGGGTPETEERLIQSINGRLTASAVGFSATFGGQYQINQLMTAGLALRLPEIGITSSQEGGLVVGGASVNAPTPAAAVLSHIDIPPLGLGGKVLSPGRVLAGLAFALGPPQSWLEVGLDFAHALPRRAFLDPQDAVINARIGARYMLSPSWVVGGGLFSDRTPVSVLSGFTAVADKVDYYGFTLGVSKRTPLALVKDPTPEALVLVTTLSLRSSIGFGEARAGSINLDNPDAPTDLVSKVTYYEIMPYLGSAVIF